MNSRTLIQYVAGAAVCMVLLTGCTSGGTSAPTGPTVTSDPAAPKAIKFAVAGQPSMAVDQATAKQMVFSRGATFVGDQLLLDMNSNGVASFTPTDGTPVWSLSQYGSKVGDGMTRALPMRTSTAAGGIVLAGYKEDCDVACPGAPKGALPVVGVAALAAKDKKVVWRSKLWTSGPPGSATDYDNILLEPQVVDADEDAVLVTLSTPGGVTTPGGTPGMTTLLLDAATGKVRWRVNGFRGSYLTAQSVFGVASPNSTTHNAAGFIDAAVSRASGGSVKLQLPAGSNQWVSAVNGPGAVMNTADNTNTTMESHNIYLVDADGRPTPSGADKQNLAAASCPEYRTGGMLACVITARSHPSVLITWASGEAHPTSVAAPLPNDQQAWAVSGDLVLITENGYQGQTPDQPTTWFAARRDGTPISRRYPGAAIAASKNYVLVKTLDAKGYPVFKVWKITQRP